ncbi:MAG: glycoside hydrolase family 38 C-terminal domain-containing protein, partial [Anaerolineae bacterium]
MPCQPTEVHVISHFHWDREWYQPFQDYRRRLVTAMDELLDILARDPAYRHFWLDGQTIVLEDYLEIRPEREMELRTYLASGRIAAGPWYVQPDEALVSGEALIRNLLMGHRLARAYGGTVPKVGYVPDIFGHISQLPQILRGFGIDNALLWRGVESEGMPSELAWEGADGSHVLLVRFPENWGYSAWHHRVRIPHIADPLDEHKLVEAVRGFLAYKAERATTPVIIAMDGTDHAEPDPRLPEWLALLQERIPGVQFIHSTPMAFLERLRPWVHKPAPVNGELRHPSQSARTANWLLNGVLSSRIHLKQRNTLCQTLLERWAEPFAALAHVHAGVPYPRSYLRLAWKHLLQNHPHDSICGCSVDQVHQDMLYRFDQARLIADATTAEALRHLTDDVGVAEGTPGAQLLTIYNPAPAPFAGTVLVDLEVPAAPLVKQRALHDPVRHFMHVFDAEGQPVPAQICALHPQEERPVRRGPGHWPWETVDRYRVAMHAHVPACGYATYTYERREEPLRRAGSMAAGPRTWEGRSLRLSVNGDGSLNLLDKETGVEYRDLLVWEDVGDVGDGWMHFSPLCDRRVTSVGACATVSAECEGPLFTRLRLDWRLRVPACAPDERERSREEVDLPITAWLDFPYDARQIAVRVRVDNVARDHALR